MVRSLSLILVCTDKIHPTRAVNGLSGLNEWQNRLRPSSVVNIG